MTRHIFKVEKKLERLIKTISKHQTHIYNINIIQLNLQPFKVLRIYSKVIVHFKLILINYTCTNLYVYILYVSLLSILNILDN